MRRFSWRSAGYTTAILAGGGCALAGAAALLGLPGGIVAIIGAKSAEFVVTGLTLLGIGTKEALEDSPRSNETQAPVSVGDLALRERALTEMIALGAYFVIGIPIAFIVLNIARDLPVSSGVIAFAFAYIGYGRFIGEVPKLRVSNFIG